MQVTGKIIISLLLILLETYHDAKREKLEIGSYDERLDYFTKVIKALGIFVALSFYFYQTQDLAFVSAYMIIRLVLFDLFYSLFAKRRFSFKNFWLLRLIDIWRNENGQKNN